MAGEIATRRTYATFAIESLPAEPEPRPEGAPARRVAIIVPHRNRAADLRRFFEHFAALDARGDRFDVFVVEQAGNGTFNRGMLLNVGFRAARAAGDYDRYILHDVDNYPTQAMFDFYAAFPERNVHFASPLLDYKYHYASFLGGVLGVRARDFEAANGFPTAFFGWGGEDDAFRKRLEAAGARVWRPVVGCFLLADDVRDVGNDVNPNKDLLCKYDWRHWRANGLNRMAASKVRVSELAPATFFAAYPAADPTRGGEAPLWGRARFLEARFAKADFDPPAAALARGASKPPRRAAGGARRTRRAASRATAPWRGAVNVSGIV